VHNLVRGDHPLILRQTGPTSAMSVTRHFLPSNLNPRTDHQTFSFSSLTSRCWDSTGVQITSRTISSVSLTTHHTERRRGGGGGGHIPGTGAPGRLNFCTAAPRLLENLSHPALYTNHMNKELAYSKMINCTIITQLTDLGSYPSKVKYNCQK